MKKGSHHTEESKRLIKEKRKLQTNIGMRGKCHTDEAKEKNRQAHLGTSGSFTSFKKGNIPHNKGKNKNNNDGMRKTSEKMTGKNNPSYKGGKIKITCKQCNKEFKVFPAILNQSFCSKECQYKNHEKIKYICKQCNKEFTDHPSKGERFFCSNECSHIYFSGKNHPSYIDGNSTKYCYKFNNKLKTKIRNRDNNICQLCGKKKEQEISELSVHHIHYDKENCDPNLITLCRSCNLKANKYRDYWEVYLLRKLVFRGLAKIYNLTEIGINNYGVD